MVDEDKLESIFATVLPLPNDQRAVYLDGACCGDGELRKRVEALLAASAAAGSFFDKLPAAFTPTIATGQGDTVDEAAGEISLDFLTPSDKPNCLGTLGQHDVIEVVGRGGMGIVLRAYDTKLNRVVAIKVMVPELAANPVAVKRFLREAQAAAAVSHDHVVSIFAIHDDNKPPFIVMECVDGQSLQEKIDRTGGLDLKEILRIGMQVARGLLAAHEQGLVHRDIKPANILLENGVERVKLTDFGLARAIDDVSVTRTGQIAGTPQFMSPEQAQGHPLDACSDLFSLGSVLYTMCTGRPPFRAETAVAMLRRVTDDDPRPIREVNEEIPDWLEAIIFKLLAKEPDERFQSAEEVAELLSRHLAHLQHPTTAPKPQPIVPPIRAGGSQSNKPPKATAERVPRWLGPIAGTVAACAGFLLFAIAAVVIYIKTDYGTIRVEVNDPNTTITIDDDMGVNFQNTDGGNLTVRAGDHSLSIKQNDLEFETDKFRLRRGDEVVISVELIDGKLGARLKRNNRVIGLRREGQVTQEVMILTDEGAFWHFNGEGKPVTTHEKITTRKESAVELRVFALEWQDADRTKAYIRIGANRYLRGIVNRDGELVVMNERGNSELFDVEWLDRRDKSFRLRTRDGEYVTATAGRLTTDRQASDTAVFTLLPFRTQPTNMGKLTELVRFEGHTEFIDGLAFSPDGKVVVTGADDGTVRAWEVSSGKEIWRHEDLGSVNAVATSPDGRFVAAGAQGKHQVHLLELSTGESVRTMGVPGRKTHSLVFSPDSEQLIGGDNAGATTVWDVATGDVIRRLTRGGARIECVALSADGSVIIASDYDGNIRCWNATDWTLQTELSDPSFEAAISGDGTLVVTGSGTLFDMRTGQTLKRLDLADNPNLHFTSDGRHIVACQWSNLLRIINVATGEEVARVKSPTNAMNEVALSPDGQCAVTGGGFMWDGKYIRSGDNVARLWRLPESVWPIAAEISNSVGMNLRLMPSGDFTMGTRKEDLSKLPADASWFFADFVPDRRQAETPQHRVSITKPFYLAAHEVKVGQFRRFIEATGYKTTAEQDNNGYGWWQGEWREGPTFNWQNPGFEQTDDHPVCNVSWDDAVAFCRWLSEKEGVTYRLPTEAEWEYACRAGTTTHFSTGDDPSTLQGYANLADATLQEERPSITWAVNWEDGFVATAPVGSFKPNAFGLYDMHGNAWEWCQDVYNDFSRTHIFRGGGFDNWPGFLRSADRYSSHSPTLRTDWAGFRVVRETDADQADKP